MALESQIQSVSLERVLQKAFYIDATKYNDRYEYEAARLEEKEIEETNYKNTQRKKSHSKINHQSGVTVVRNDHKRDIKLNLPKNENIVNSIQKHESKFRELSLVPKSVSYSLHSHLIPNIEVLIDRQSFLIHEQVVETAAASLLQENKKNQEEVFVSPSKMRSVNENSVKNYDYDEKNEMKLDSLNNLGMIVSGIENNDNLITHHILVSLHRLIREETKPVNLSIRNGELCISLPQCNIYYIISCTTRLIL